MQEVDRHAAAQRGPGVGGVRPGRAEPVDEPDEDVAQERVERVAGGMRDAVQGEDQGELADSAEFTLVLALNGVSHPTGYPLFTLLGHVFVRLLHGLGATWPYAANAWTALGGGVAIYLLHRLAVSLVPSVAASRRWATPGADLPAGAAAGRTLRFQPVWTYETTLAEVYSWHIAWVLGTALCFVRWRGPWRPGGTAGPAALRGAPRPGASCAEWAGRITHQHRVAAPLSIAIVVVLAVAATAAGRASSPPCCVAACVPLLSYGFILWRASHPAAVPVADARAGFRGLARPRHGRQYQGLLGRFSPSDEQGRFLLWYVYPFLFPGLLLALVNAVRARAGRASARSSAAARGLRPAGDRLRVRLRRTDPSSYFLHPMTLGLVALMPLLGRDRGRWRPRARRDALAVPRCSPGGPRALGSVDAHRPAAHGPLASFDQLVHQMWLAIPADSGVVFWTNDMCTKLLAIPVPAGREARADHRPRVDHLHAERADGVSSALRLRPGRGNHSRASPAADPRQEETRCRRRLWIRPWRT